MLRETIDLYSSYIDRPKVVLVFQLWYVTLLTAIAGVIVTAGGHAPWQLPTYLVVWLAVFLTLETLYTLAAALLNFWLIGRDLQQPALQAAGQQSGPAIWTTFPQAEGSSLHAPEVYWEDPEAFWDIPPGSEGAPHE